MDRVKLKLSGAVVLIAALIGFAANFTSVLTWLGYSPSASYPTFELSLSCNSTAACTHGCLPEIHRTDSHDI